jgi:hypothetical protein
MWEKVGATAMNSKTSDARSGVANESVRQFFSPTAGATPRRKSRPQRRRWWGKISWRSQPRFWWVGLLVIAFAGLGLLVVTMSAPQFSGSGAAPAAIVNSEQPAENVAIRPAAWHGILLPVTQNQPSRLTTRHATGFSRSALGAAIAATHLSVRVDPTAGPRVFLPVLRQQVRGDGERWLRRIRNSYQEIAAAWRVKDGGSIPLAAGRVVGWRSWLAVEDGRGAQVDLLVLTPQQQRKVFRINLSWRRGDWRLVLPPANADELFTVKPASKNESFTRFFPENAR